MVPADGCIDFKALILADGAHACILTMIKYDSPARSSLSTGELDVLFVALLLDFSGIRERLMS